MSENPTTEKMSKTFAGTLPESFYQSFKSYNLPFRYVTSRNSLWRQYHAGNKEFVMSFTNHLSDSTKKALEALNLPTLKKIFACAKGKHFIGIVLYSGNRPLSSGPNLWAIPMSMLWTPHSSAP